VKKWLKLVYMIYGRYREIKTGVSLFWTTLYNRNQYCCQNRKCLCP